VGLGGHAAAGVSEQLDPAQAEGGADCLRVLDHGFHRVARRVLKLLRLTRPPLVQEDEPVVARQRDEVRQEVVVGRPGPAVQNQEWFALAEGLVVDEASAGIDVSFLDPMNRSRFGFPWLPGLLAGRRSPTAGQPAQGAADQGVTKDLSSHLGAPSVVYAYLR